MSEKTLTKHDCHARAEALLKEMKALGQSKEMLLAFAQVMQCELSIFGEREVPHAGGLDYIMRGVSVALKSPKDKNCADYIVGNIRQGADYVRNRYSEL